MKKANSIRTIQAKRPGLLASWLMVSLFLAPLAFSQETERKPKYPAGGGFAKPAGISTAELAANPDRFLGKNVSVRARIEKVFTAHWFSINEAEPGPNLLVLVTKPARSAPRGENVTVTGCVRKLSRSEIEKEYGPIGLDPQIEAQFKARPLIVAESITTTKGENIVAQPKEDDAPKTLQEKAPEVHRVRASGGNLGHLVALAAKTPRRTADEATPKAQAKISREAQTMLDQMRAAYDNLEAIELNGQIQANVQMEGQKQKLKHQFTSSFEAPNKFRHELEDGLLIGSTGDKTYVFQKSANAFFQQKAADGKVSIRDLPSPIPQLLQTQNPSPLFAIIRDPIGGVTDNMKEITKTADIRIQDKSYPALALTPQDGQSKITLLVDPDTRLLKRLDIEITADTLKGNKTPAGLQSVRAEIEYTTIRPKAKFEAEHFAWAPPDGAKDLAEQKEKTSAQSLIGKPAPEFTLQTVDGESVSLSELKGQVVVLDFWATWCPPCVKSLPELDQIHQQKAGDGVKVYAINLRENEQQIHSFLQSRGLSIPVLMDSQGDVAKKYNVHAIPQTIVIGKDGEVKKVFVGAANGTADQLRAEIESQSGREAVGGVGEGD